MKKQLLALLLVAMMILVSACSTQAPASSSAPPVSSTDSSEPVGEAFDPTSISGEITFWTAWTEDNGVGDWIAEFNKAYPNITVTPVQYSNNTEGNLKLNASLLAGEGVDVVLNYTYANYLQRAASGLLYNVTDFAARDGVDFVAEWGIDNKTDDKYFGLPIGGNTDKIYVNLDMVADAGLTLPESWTLDEYTEFARKLTAGSGSSKVYGTSDMHSGQIYWSRMARGLLGSNYYYNKDGLSNFDDPAFAKSLQFKYDMEEKEKIQFPYLEYKASGMQAPDAFISGKTAMTVCTGMIARWISDTEKYPHDFKVAVMPMPSLENDAKNYNDGIYYFSYLGIGAKSKNPDAAWVFSNWFATEGSKGLATVGHVPLWKNANKDDIIKIMFGENAEKVVDIESVKKNLLNFDGATYLDDHQVAYSEIENIAKENMEYAMTGEMTVEQALALMKQKADDVIKAAK